jgi:hypothetical protein
MTDIEIDKELALAIGYKLFDVKFHDDMWAVVVYNGSWRVFSHRDWNVIGPIAERYNAFPIQSAKETWSACVGDGSDLWVDHIHTPQKAIALAVIGATK